MNIRPATEEDAKSISVINDEVQKVHAEAMPHIFKPPSARTFPETEITGLLNDQDNIFLVALEDEHAIAYLYAQVVHGLESSLLFPFERLYIHHIAVRWSHQGKGFGKALVDRLLELAKSKDISTVVLDVWSFNEGARQFFMKRGFTVFNERMWVDVENK